jgi:hypothetical protein
MRCPYCGGINNDQARFCANCGRDMVPQKPGTQPAPGQRYQPQGQPGQRPSSQPSYTQPSSYAQPRTPAQPTRTAPQPQPARPTAPAAPVTRQPASAPVAPASPVLRPPISAPDAPAPFPPRTMEQLKALTQGALAFNVVDESIVNGRKKVVSIVYPRCAPWQQVATLLKALEQTVVDKKFEAIVIQGVSGANAVESSFTNGQLRYDRNVPLGSQKINRYQIETGGSLDFDSIRIVLSEPCSE